MQYNLIMRNVDELLYKLSKSKFRSSFKLKNKEKEYIKRIGLNKIKEHAYDFIRTRISPKNVLNDGRQTPMHGHPVFIAQHATATCCRTCLYKWHRISVNKELSESEIEYIINIIMKWIIKELGEKDEKM